MKSMKRLWLVGVVWLASCTKPNPDRCCNDEADCAAKNIPVGSQCDDGLLCRGNQCIAQTCGSNDSCDPSAPFCIEALCALQCVEDAHCPGYGGQASTPYCIQGACVACRDSADCTTADAAVCEAGACRGCAMHSECASNLCDVDNGTCIDESTVVYAASSGSASSNCTKSDPCTLDRAAVVVTATRPNVKLAEGTHVATASWAFSTVPVNPSLYGPAIISGALTLSGIGAFKLRDLELGALSVTGQSSTTTSLDAARLSIPQGALEVFQLTGTVRSSKVVAPPITQNAVRIGGTTPTTLTLDGVEMVSGKYGVFIGPGSAADIRNCIIRDQDTYFTTTRNAIIAHDTAVTSSVSFTTFYNTLWNCPSLSNVVKVHSRNNIFVNDAPGAPADTVSGTQCSHNYDIIKPQSATPVGGNNLLNSDPHFANPTAGDFHLTTGSIAIDTADPAAIEMFDFDGTMRPQGSARDIGAFEFKP